MAYWQPISRKDVNGVPSLDSLPGNPEDMRSFLRCLEKMDLVHRFDIPNIPNRDANILLPFLEGFDQMMLNATEKKSFSWPEHISTRVIVDENAENQNLRQKWDAAPFHLLKPKHQKKQTAYAVNETVDYTYFTLAKLGPKNNRTIVRDPTQTEERALVYIC